VEKWTERERGGAAAMWWSKWGGVAAARERRGRKDEAVAPGVVRGGERPPRGKGVAGVQTIRVRGLPNDRTVLT
jgi:hypothetical protein